MGRVRLATLWRTKHPALPGITAVARVDRRTRQLVKRLRPGDIAIIDHVDIDRLAAESLVECGVAAVVNAATSISGRYPNLGPEILVANGIPLLDGVGTGVLADVRDGDIIRLCEGALYAGDRVIATGEQQTIETVQQAMADARAGLAVQLEAFAANTMEYLRRDRDLLLDGVGVPEIATDLAGKQVLVVVRGYNHREDLAALRRYIRAYRPVLIGVDAGADVLLDSGYRPAVVVGDLESLSNEALRCGAEIVVRTDPDGRAPDLDRIHNLGLTAVEFAASGTSEDAALLLADAKGAALIATAGTHATLVEFLDKGRSGMASTFLTRLRVGGKLVDAKLVSRLYRSRISTSSLLLLVFSAIVTLVVVIGLSPVGQVYLTLLGAKWDSFVSWLARCSDVVDFKYHVVSIVAVFLALAVGIVLGTNVLSGDVLKNLKTETSQLRKEAQDLRAQTAQQAAQLNADQAFAQALEPIAVTSRLATQRVVVIMLPGAPKSVRDQSVNTLADAGATVTGEIEISGSFVDATQAQTLDELVKSLVRPGVDLSPAPDVASRAAAVLAAALIAPGAAALPSAAATQ